MKTKFRLLSALTVLMTALTMTSCYVESDGPVGAAGKDGWSDIKVINFTINYNSWLRDNSETNFWYYTYNTSLVDYYVVDNGAVLFYYGYYDNSGQVNKWYFIPFTNVYYEGSSGRYYEKIYDATYQPGRLELEIRDTNPLRFDWPDDKDVKIKAIILEGETYNMLLKKGTDLRDYAAVRKLLDIHSDAVTR